MSATPLLQLRDLRVAYGAIEAVKGISLELAHGELVSLIGANGAGKTTTLNAIAGTSATAGGELLYEGKGIEKLPPTCACAAAWRWCRKGAASSPASPSRRTCAWAPTAGATTTGRGRPGAGVHHAAAGQGAPAAGGRHPVGGEQQMVAIGRALLSRPRCCCLDEPSMGLARWWSRRSSR